MIDFDRLSVLSIFNDLFFGEKYIDILNDHLYVLSLLYTYRLIIIIFTYKRREKHALIRKIVFLFVSARRKRTMVTYAWIITYVDHLKIIAYSHPYFIFWITQTRITVIKHSFFVVSSRQTLPQGKYEYNTFSEIESQQSFSRDSEIKMSREAYSLVGIKNLLVNQNWRRSLSVIILRVKQCAVCAN